MSKVTLRRTSTIVYDVNTEDFGTDDPREIAKEQEEYGNGLYSLVIGPRPGVRGYTVTVVPYDEAPDKVEVVA